MAAPQPVGSACLSGACLVSEFEKKVHFGLSPDLSVFLTNARAALQVLQERSQRASARSACLCDIHCTYCDPTGNTVLTPAL